MDNNKVQFVVGVKGKQYGLQPAKTAPKLQEKKPAQQKKPMNLLLDDDDDELPLKEEVKTVNHYLLSRSYQEQKKKEQAELWKKAVEEDPTVFTYDDFQEANNNSRAKQRLKPKQTEV